MINCSWYNNYILLSEFPIDVSILADSSTVSCSGVVLHENIAQYITMSYYKSSLNCNCETDSSFYKTRSRIRDRLTGDNVCINTFI